jgi:uncharacterized membrane protein
MVSRATITPLALQNIGYGTYLLFMAFMILGTLWAWFLLPELKNKTLEEVSLLVKGIDIIFKPISSIVSLSD